MQVQRRRRSDLGEHKISRLSVWNGVCWWKGQPHNLIVLQLSIVKKPNPGCKSLKESKVHATVFEDNQSTYFLATNQKITNRTKYLLSNWHWFRDLYNHGYEFRNEHTWPHFDRFTEDDPNQKLKGMTIYFARMMIGHLLTYTDGEFKTAVTAINEAIIKGMADQNSSGESDLYTLPILCMLNFHLMNHAKIDTILWYPSYDV